MNQKEFIKAIVELAKEREINISQNVAKELLDVIENVIDDAILDGQVVKALGCKFETIKKEAKSGVAQLSGEAKEWHKPAHMAAKVSYLPKKKKELEREI